MTSKTSDFNMTGVTAALSSVKLMKINLNHLKVTFRCLPRNRDDWPL